MIVRDEYLIACLEDIINMVDCGCSKNLVNDYLEELQKYINNNY